MDADAAARSWIDAWSRAWRALDAALLEPTYAPDAVHRSHPFRDPGNPVEYARWALSEEEGEKLAKSLFRPFWGNQEKQVEEKALSLLERFKLLEKRADYAGSLSGGQRKLLEMARALMSDPKMIMLDEPMAGVNPALTQSLLGHIQSLRDEGTTVLFVEHDMHVVRHISDWVGVMAEGRIVAEGPSDTVMSDQAVIDAYLGAHHDTDLGDDALLTDATLEQYEKEVAEEDAEREEEHR